MSTFLSVSLVVSTFLIGVVGQSKMVLVAVSGIALLIASDAGAGRAELFLVFIAIAIAMAFAWMVLNRLRAGSLHRLLRVLSEIRAVIFASVGLYLFIAFASYSLDDPGWSQTDTVAQLHNLGGPVGAYISDLLLFVFGHSAWWWCVLLLRAGWTEYRCILDGIGETNTAGMKQNEQAGSKTWILFLRRFAFTLLLCSSAALEYIWMPLHTPNLPLVQGGVLGELLGGSIRASLGASKGTLFVLTTFFLSLTFWTGTQIIVSKFKQAIESIKMGASSRQRETADDNAKEYERHQSGSSENKSSHDEAKTYTENDTRTDEEILGVEVNCSIEALKKAYREQSQRLHPDKWQSKPLHIRTVLEEEQKLLNAAYSRLKAKFAHV